MVGSSLDDCRLREHGQIVGWIVLGDGARPAGGIDMQRGDGLDVRLVSAQWWSIFGRLCTAAAANDGAARHCTAYSPIRPRQKRDSREMVALVHAARDGGCGGALRKSHFQARCLLCPLLRPRCRIQPHVEWTDGRAPTPQKRR